MAERLHDVGNRAELAAATAENERLTVEVSNLHIALDTRTAIAMAMGMLMEQSKVTPDDAFTLLRRASQRTNRKLHDIAADVVADHIKRIGDG